MSKLMSESAQPATANPTVRSLPGPAAVQAPLSVVRFLTDPFSFLQSLTARYGDVVGFRMGPVNYCLINRPDLIHEVLVARNSEFTKGAVLAFVTKWIMGNGLLSSEGELHKRQRRLCQPAFDRQHLTQYSEVMVDNAVSMQEPWSDGDEIDLYHTMSEFALSTAAKTLFGVNIEGQLRDFHAAYREVQRGYSMLQLMLTILLYKVGINRYFSSNRSERALQQLNDIVYGIIAAKQKADQPGDDLLSHLIRATDADEDGSGMDRGQLRDEAMTFVLAGHDTIATSLTWTWYLLSRHPEVERQLHEEVDAVVGDRLPTAADLPQLKHTGRVFAEAMRLYPAIWTISRNAVSDVILGGFRIPAGTQVMLSPYVTQRDARYFPDPLAFRPDRWLDDEPVPPEMSYFPFGGGRRMCIGRSFALMEGPLVLATIARRWRLKCLDARPADVRRAVVLQPQRPIPMRLERRSK